MINSHFYLSLRSVIISAALLLVSAHISAQPKAATPATIDVGVASVDITPEGPIRLAGYGAREKAESKGVLQRLHAKAMAFGDDANEASVIITVDLVGITWPLTAKLGEQLAAKAGLKQENLVICASHTHGGPEIGNLLNILQYRGDTFSDSLLAREQLDHIAAYREQLSHKLEEVALAALKDRKPALISWGQGQAQFAANRRTKGGPVDPALPLLRVTDPDGSLRAILTNYACHGTTLGGNVNQIHGDWIGEAQKVIQERHPGVIAMVAIGCGADANPSPRGNIDQVKQYGKEIADNVDKLLTAQLQPLNKAPVAKMKWVNLPFSHIPMAPELIELTKDQTVKGYYARLALDRLLRGDSIPSELAYPVQVWNFDDKMAMVNLAGEVVVDYSTRLKNDLGAERLWMNGYANDVPCYIASKRVIQEGGYEAESSMYYYDRPSPFSENIEDIIIDAVYDLMPQTFKDQRAIDNKRELIRQNEIGEIHLTAAKAEAIGPDIKYMPEWKAFGWFTTKDKAEWDVQVDKKETYDVYLEWSVDDDRSGKAFIFRAGNKSIKGRFKQTGSWFTFRKEKIGRLRLNPGRYKMVLQSDSPSEMGAMMDLREIILVPVNKGRK